MSDRGPLGVYSAGLQWTGEFNDIHGHNVINRTKGPRASFSSQGHVMVPRSLGMSHHKFRSNCNCFHRLTVAITSECKIPGFHSMCDVTFMESPPEYVAYAA